MKPNRDHQAELDYVLTNADDSIADIQGFVRDAKESGYNTETHSDRVDETCYHVLRILSMVSTFVAEGPAGGERLTERIIRRLTDIGDDAQDYHTDYFG